MSNENHINDILKNLRKNIKPSSGPLTSIDPKKLAKASKDVQTAKEVAEMVKQNSSVKKQEEGKKP